MNELAVCFGTSASLIGVYSEPAIPAEEDVPTVLVLTAGLVHRSGPFRLHVEVARRLAELGYPCFRFDQAGIGDSAPRSDDLPDQDGAAKDIQIAMDYLQSRLGTKRFVFFGLCSGADNSHFVAVRDRRVAGFMVLDAFAYPTLGYYLRRYARFARNPRHVYRSGISKIRARRHCPETTRREIGDPKNACETAARIIEREFPPRDKVGTEIQTLVDRGLQALYVYTGGYTWYNYPGQFFDNFPNVRRNPRIEVEYFSQADHTYFLVDDRQRLIDRVEKWMTSRFPFAPKTE